MMAQPIQSARLWQFLRRALRLRCPECGQARIFKPWRQTRSLDDWFHPLHGCPNCNYPYQREPGYFLISICVLNYGVVTGGAIAVSLLLDMLIDPPLWSVLFVRHAKAIFLAIDHYIEPHSVGDANVEANEEVDW